MHQVIVLVSTTTTAGIYRRRVFIDDLWRLVDDLGRLVGNMRRLVGRRNELRRRIVERGLGRRVELSNHFSSCLPEKE